MKIRKGDRVKVIAGRSKGKVGDVLRVLPTEQRVVVQGVNVVKRHTKPGRTDAGGIISKELSVHLSNLAVADPKDGKPTRIGFKFVGEGADRKRVRIAKRSGAEIDG